MFIINYDTQGKETSIEKVDGESEEPKNWGKVTSVEDFRRLVTSPYRFEVSEYTGEKRPYTSEYWEKHGEEIDRNLLEGKLESLSQELKICKKDLRINSPYLHSSILKKLKSMNYDMSLLSKDLPNIPQEYHERITELNNHVQETIKEQLKISI